MKQIRVLHVALNDAYQENPISRALRNQGAVVYEVPWKTMLGNMKTFDYPIFWHNLLEGIKMMRPQITFMQIGPDVIPPAIAQQMSELTFLVNWTGDVREDMLWMRELAPVMGLSLFTNTTNVEEFNKLGLRADYLQVSFDEKTYFPHEKAEISKYATEVFAGKIVFLGNNYAKRKENSLSFPLTELREKMVRTLKQQFETGFRVFGTDWDAEDYSLIPVQEAECYRSCAMAINLSHFEYGHYSSDRLLRIMASGAMALTHRYPGLEEDFNVGEHLIAWDTIDELVDLCHFYNQKKNISKREKIARAGCEYVHKNCTWDNRMQTLYTLCLQYSPASVTRNDNWIQGLRSVTPEKHYSQYGEESYLGYIFLCIGTTNKYFVDIGAGDGSTLSNTKFFQERMAFDGLMIDDENGGNDRVKRHFITRDNVLQFMREYQVPESFDLLSLDLDGNDYWILDKLLTEYKPRVIIAEFNGTIAEGECKTIAYNENHRWGNNDYYGFSLEAAKVLAKNHGYRLIHQTTSTNLYLVRCSELANPEREIDVRYEVMQYHAKNSGGQWVDLGLSPEEHATV